MGGRKDNSGGLDRWVPSLFVLHSCPLIDSRDFNSLSPGIITPIRVAEPQDPDPDGKESSTGKMFKMREKRPFPKFICLRINHYLFQ